MLIACFASVALADDFKTLNGKEYKDATVTRVEPDGITVKFSGGLVKIPFTELPKDLQDKYHYNPKAAQKFAADSAAQINADNASTRVDTTSKKVEENPYRLLQSVMIFAIIKPFHYGREDTTVSIQEYQKFWVGPTAYDFEWKQVGKEFTAVIDEPMPQYYENGDVIPVALYRIGHSNDSSRYPLYTMHKEKAMELVLGGSGK
jgi:hypothetical protein